MNRGRWFCCLAAWAVVGGGNMMAGEFSDFAKKADAGDRLNVVFLGGSLTWGAQSTDPTTKSYRAVIARKFEEKYPRAHFRFFDAAIGGTGSQLAAFRLERDVLAHDPDLVFLEFAVNDNASEVNSHRLAAYESLVRRLVKRGIPVVQAIFSTKGDYLPGEKRRPLWPKHKEIAAAYGLPIADAVEHIGKVIESGKATPDDLWDLPEDGTHPGDAGYALYAEACWNAFQQAVKDDFTIKVPEKMLNADKYMRVARNRLTAIESLPKGWEKGRPNRIALAFDFVCSRWMDDLVIAKPGAEPLRFKFKGSDVLLFGEKTRKSGNFTVRIDGGQPEKISAASPDGNMRLMQVVAEGLDPHVEHEIEIVPELKDGEELRIESICVAG
jgi:lysophospholipase L1-like esterase